MVTEEFSREAAPSLLFEGPVRFGYELVKPTPAALSPERTNPPPPPPLPLIPRAKAVGLRKVALVEGVATVVVWFVDSVVGAPGYALGQGPAVVIIIFMNMFAAVVAFWAAIVWLRWKQLTPAAAAAGRSPRVSIRVAFLNAFGALFVPWLVFPVEAVIALISASRDSAMVPDQSQAPRLEIEHQKSIAAWQTRVMEFEAAERRREETVDLWFPVPVPGTARMICAFGGSSISWTALLTTLGATMMGANRQIFIADFSRRHTTDDIRNLCRSAGYPVQETVITASDKSQDDTGLFADLTWKDLATVLVEVLHSEQTDADVSRRERQEDRAVILDVTGCLAKDGFVSVTRLRQALLVVEGVEEHGASLISIDEYDDLTKLFNEVQRKHGGVMERVTRIERSLRTLDVAGRALHYSSDRSQERTTGLQIIAADKDADDLDNEQYVAMLVQLITRRIKKGNSMADVLVILGADRMRLLALEALLAHAERERIGVFLFFEHFRQDAVDVVGAGGAAAIFFSLGNSREAIAASDFIGSGYKWVESQRTRSKGDSFTRTEGEEHSTGEQRGATWSQTTTDGRSYSEAFGKSNEKSVADQRVREAILDPEMLMGLPPTGLVCVQVLPGGRRVVNNVNCNPQITFAPRVAHEPRALNQVS
jgi:hypothetical protein